MEETIVHPEREVQNRIISLVCNAHEAYRYAGNLATTENKNIREDGLT